MDAGVPLAPGAFDLVFGPSSVLSELEARLLLSTVASGQDVVLVCGDNRLDVYGLLARARAAGLEDALADGVHVARAFTLHQFIALLEETLPRMAAEQNAGLALVTGTLDLFGDEDVTPSELRALLPRTLRRLDAFAKKGEIPVVATGDARSRLAPMAREFALHRDVSALPRSSRQPSLESFAGAA